MPVLLTGATGFLGRAIINRLQREHEALRVVSRRSEVVFADDIEMVGIATLDHATSWQAALIGIDTVVHCAARVHVLKDRASAPLTGFRRVNTDGTLNLARQAVAGVRRFIFISYHRCTWQPDWRYRLCRRLLHCASDAVCPVEMGSRVGFARNRSSKCHANRRDQATPDLWSTSARQFRFAAARGKSALLLPVSLLRRLANMAGKQRQFDQLAGSLHLDISKVSDLLQRRPVIGVNEALRQAFVF
jgi:hypothetical protein